MRGKTIGENHHLAYKKARRRIRIDFLDFDLIVLDVNLQFRTSKRNCSVCGPEAVQLPRQAMQGRERAVAGFDGGICLLIREPVFDSDRRKNNAVSHAIALLIESHFYGERWAFGICL